jgi:hypothetical protein
MARSIVKLATVVASLIAVCGCTAAASAVTNISQLRTVYGYAYYGSPVTQSSDQTGQWDQTALSEDGYFGSYGTASLSSLISAVRFSAQSTIYAEDDVQNTWAEARSTFTAKFELADATDYSLRGAWRSYTFNGGPYTRYDSGIALRRISPDPMVIFDGNSGPTTTSSGSVNLGGSLQPGIYEIVARAYVYAGTNPGWTQGFGGFNFDLIVPSPGAASVLLLGGVGVLGRRRRV